MAAVRIASIENHHHQEPPPSLSPRACPRASTWLPVHRALRERRALRRASRVAAARRPGVGCSAASINPSLVEELQRSSLAHRRAFAAAAHQYAATAAAADFCARQRERQQQQQQQQQQKLAWPALSLLATAVIATPPTPPPAASAATASAAASAAAAATGLPRPAATSLRVQDTSINVNPEIYFLSLLEKRGRAVTKNLSSQEAGYVKQPTAKQVLDYQSQPFMSDLVRKEDLHGLQEAVEAGRGMDASNKFGESLVHIACRRGNMNALRFLLDNGGSLTCCDDLGRFPLHEVCWAVRPRFDIVRLFLDGKRRPTPTANNTNNNNDSNNTTNSNNNNNNSSNNNKEEDEVLIPLLVTDKRGCTPLRYVKEESWPLWRQFLDEVVDEYWPSLV